jgi:hypothetical protein
MSVQRYDFRRLQQAGTYFLQAPDFLVGDVDQECAQALKLIEAVRRRSRRGFESDAPVLDGGAKSRPDEPTLRVDTLLRATLRPDDVAQPGTNEHFEGGTADVVGFHTGALEIRFEFGFRIGYIGWRDLSGRRAGILPQIQPIRRNEKEELRVPWSPVGEDVPPRPGRPFVRRSKLVLDFSDRRQPISAVVQREIK